MSRPWGNSSSVGSVYLIDKDTDRSRVGCCWMSGRLLIGDVILCTQHSGDHFYNYILLEPFVNGVQGIPDSKFGAYTLGRKLDWEPTCREYHLLCAGETLHHSSTKGEFPLYAELQNIGKELLKKNKKK